MVTLWLILTVKRYGVKMEYIYFNKQNIDDLILWQQGNGHNRDHP